LFIVEWDSLNLNGLLVIGISLGVLLVIGFYIASIFNKLFRFKNAAEATLNQIGVALRKRLDMVEQLLGAVKGYVSHERELFESIAALRSSLVTGDVKSLDSVDEGSLKLTGDIMAIAEAYPELKANETVVKLMDAVVSVEDEIARQRYTHNNVVQEFNTMLDTIPSSWVARSQGLEKLGYLEFEGGAARPEITGISER